MKRRIGTDHLQPLSPIGLFQGHEIDLERLDEVIGKIGIFSVKRLAADDDELLLAGYTSGGAQHMINFPLLHSASLLPPAIEVRQMASISAPSRRSLRVQALPQKEHLRLRFAQCLAIHRRPVPRYPGSSIDANSQASGLV